jgi:uncharacterized protein (DUF427 family)
VLTANAPPRDALRTIAGKPSTRTYCNYKGYATYWAAVVGDTVVDDVAWSYADPPPECLPIKGYLSFDAARAEVLAELPASGQADCGCEV